MPEVFVNPNLPNYFVVADQVTNETIDRSYVPEYEDSKVIVFPNVKPSIDHEFWAKLPTDKYPDLKKLKSEIDMTQPGHDPALLQRLKRLNLPAGLAEAIQENIGKFYESILPAYTSIFGGYKFTRCRAVWRLTTTRNENMHFDTYLEEHQAHFARMFINIDTVPRIWHTSWRADDAFEQKASEFPTEMLQSAKASELWIHLNRLVFGGSTSVWWDEQPRHVAYFEPGDVWAVDSRQIAHQIFYGRRAVSIDFFVDKESMGDPNRHYLSMVENFRARELLKRETSGQSASPGVVRTEPTPLVRLPYEEARQNSLQPSAQWPKTADKQAARLSPFALPEFRPSFSVGRDDLVFTIGSCFARNIESEMLNEGFNVAVGSFGRICEEEGVTVPPSALNKFTVHSMLNELSWALDPANPAPEAAVVEVGRNRYLDMQLAPGMRPADKASVLATRRAITRYMAMAGQASVVVITLGLAEAWYDKANGLYLNYSPLKGSADLHRDRFELHSLSYEDIISAGDQIVETLQKFGRPGVRILLTVSPIPLNSTYTDDDVLTANSYSKSVQRAAAEYLYRKHDMIDYFPSYESVTLSDRSVALREDLAHASDEVIRLNVLRMMRAYTDGGAAAPIFDEAAVSQALSLSRDAEAAAKAGKAEEAEALFREAMASAPREGIIAMRYGAWLLAEGRLKDAVAVLGGASKQGAERFGAYFLLGQAQFLLRNFAEAEAALSKAREFDPGRFGIRHLLARAVARQGRRRDAYGLYRQAVPLAPNSDTCLREFADLAKLLSEQADAILLMEPLRGQPDAHEVLETLLSELRGATLSPVG